MSSAGVEKRGSAATVKACDSCRKRKRRCLWTAGADRCNHCIQLKEECTTTHVRKQRGKQQKRDRIAEYEHRIKNLESLLQDRSAAQPHVQEQPLQPADQSIPLSTWVDNLRTDLNSVTVGGPLDVRPLDYTGPLTPFDHVLLQSTAAGSSDLSLNDSPNDLVLAGTEVGGDSFEPSADFQEEANLLQNPTFQPPTHIAETIDPPDLGDPGYESCEAKMIKCNATLPEPQLGASLLAEFLVDYNTAFPLYRPYVIANHLHICYSGKSDGTALSWASAYVVLGIAHRLRAMSAVATPQDNQLADWYLSNILPTVSGLLVAPPSLGLVQCLLGLSVLIRSSATTTPHVHFVSTALRISQSLAYEYFNVECDEKEPDAQDVEQQRRVFWLAFILDTDESMYSNVPTTQRRDDITMDIPDADPQDSLGAVKAAEGDWKVNLFALRIRLVLLQAEAIESVFAIKPRKSTPRAMQVTVDDLLSRLKAWRDNEICSRTSQELNLLLYRSDLLHILFMEASYFATVFRLRAFVALGMDARINPFASRTLNKLSEMNVDFGVNDAERLLAILELTPHGEVGICWVTRLAIVAALVTILSQHVHALDPPPPPDTQSPSNHSASPSNQTTAAASTAPSPTVHAPLPEPTQDAMRAYMRMLRTLGVLVQQSKDMELQRARELCMMLYTKVEAGMRIKFINGLVDQGQGPMGIEGLELVISGST